MNGEITPPERLVLTSGDGSIELRRLVPDDAQTIYDLIEGNPDNIVSYDSWADLTHGSPETIRDFIEYSQRHSNLYRFGIWDVGEAVEVPTMVGVIELRTKENKGATATWVGPAHRGHGYAARAAEPLIDFAFNRLDLTQLLRTIMKDNIPSIKTAEKLGFTPGSTNVEGLITFILNKSVDHD